MTTTPNSAAALTQTTPPQGAMTQELIPTALASSFNTMTLQDPSDSGWYMDTGATAHLTSQPGSSNSNSHTPM
uniref:Uncharacterized protein n=1 Tax=Noccaea caerulescens TaxID=107243 RepID=A0A1J3IC71_NOCCA